MLKNQIYLPKIKFYPLAYGLDEYLVNFLAKLEFSSTIFANY